jgi:xanthine/CO dehydrogenase XdhC/CoxF family maturation factor
MNSANELIALIRSLHELRQRDFAGGGAIATIVRTHGSTFRRAGTSMLVLGDGSVVCALSGGCPQRDIIQRAQQVIATGATQLVAYNRDTGLDVLIEMGCGGELEVLIEPVASAQDIAYLDALQQCLEQRRPAWMATVVRAARGGVAGRPRRRVWTGHGALFDDLGDETALRAQLDERVARLDGDPRTTLVTSSAVGDEPLVLLERLRPPLVLFVIGAGAGADALVPLGPMLGWQIRVIDPHPERLQAYASMGLAVGSASPATLALQLGHDRDSAVVVMTHNLEQDVGYLQALRDLPLAYLGVLGSRERVATIAAALGEGVSHLRAPAGLDIGSHTPQEIALAIAAEILAVRDGRDGRPLREGSGPIH